MSVQSGPTYKRYAANGIATVFAIPFLVINAGDLAVTLNGAPVTSGFTLSGLGNPTCSATFTIAPTGDLLFQMNIPIERLTDYQTNGDLLAKTINLDLDRLWLAIKQNININSRALATSSLEPEGVNPLPVVALRMNKLLGFDVNGNPVASTLTLAQIEQQPALALSSAQAAAASAGAASTSEGNANTAALLAARWASEAEDVPVTTGLFSAFHWARKALASATAAASTLANAVLKTGAQTMAGPLSVTNGIPTIPFNKEYVSTQQAFVAVGLITLAHGLGALPKFVFIDAICLTAEGGFTAGDLFTMQVSPESPGTAGIYGIAMRRDTVNIYLRPGAGGLAGMAQSTGNGFVLTPANWRLIVRAWA